MQVLNGSTLSQVQHGENPAFERSDQHVGKLRYARALCRRWTELTRMRNEEARRRNLTSVLLARARTGGCHGRFVIARISRAERLRSLSVTVGGGGGTHRAIDSGKGVRASQRQPEAFIYCEDKVSWVRANMRLAKSPTADSKVTGDRLSAAAGGGYTNEAQCARNIIGENIRCYSQWLQISLCEVSADEGKARWVYMEHWGGGGVISEKTRRPASSCTIPTCENPEATPPGIDPGSPRWEASSLTTPPPRHLSLGTGKFRKFILGENI
ncbi:hypothetical protein PR048_022223 [Dryococelus australis]|uniref:Uncharacterized protein n=1 Tax=Dryococelus australis TaxID=614101 RepID=A0ABQ9H0F3_9NEOP|nr:hypothetical protein PR048_022223 [Dryococelus australis]